MNRDPMGMALAMMTRLAGNPLLDRLGLRKPAERAAYHGTKAGFRTLSVANREFRRVTQWLPTNRLPDRKPPSLFDLTLEEDQQLIVDSLERFARNTLRSAADHADETSTMPISVYTAAAELGLTLYAIPETFGGVAERQSSVTGVLIAEQLAWGDMGLASALLAPFRVAQTITEWGTGEQQSRYLPPFCESEPPIATIALDEPTPLFDPMKLSTRAVRCENGFRLSGTKCGVVLGGESHLMLIAAELGGNPRLFVLETDQVADSITLIPEPTMGLRGAQLSRLTLNDTWLSPEALLGNDDFDYSGFLDQNSLLTCGLAIGAAKAVLDYVIPYCNQREAFGEPISHRQSVAFIISDLAIETDSMQLLTWRAASRAETGLSFHREARLARLFCNDKAMAVGTQGVQLLGGHGFVKEHPVERWYRDLRSVAAYVG